jgi:hypothetical protein
MLGMEVGEPISSLANPQELSLACVGTSRQTVPPPVSIGHSSMHTSETAAALKWTLEMNPKALHAVEMPQRASLLLYILFLGFHCIVYCFTPGGVWKLKCDVYQWFSE